MAHNKDKNDNKSDQEVKVEDILDVNENDEQNAAEELAAEALSQLQKQHPPARQQPRPDDRKEESGVEGFLQKDSGRMLGDGLSSVIPHGLLQGRMESAQRCVKAHR